MLTEIILLLSPLAAGLVVCIAFYYLDRSRFTVRGVGPPYFGAIALLFSFFAANITVEVWQKVNRINTLLFTESSAIRSLLQVTEPFDQTARLVRGISERLLGELDVQEAEDAALVHIGDRVPPQFAELHRIAGDLNNFNGNPSAANSFYRELELLQQSWFERSELRESHIVPAKYLILFFFGLLTQIAIGFSHGGNQRALSAAVILFSLSFSGAAGIIYIMDDAHSSSILSTRSALDDLLKNTLGPATN
jgi:hypothetical protein